MRHTLLILWLCLAATTAQAQLEDFYITPRKNGYEPMPQNLEQWARRLNTFGHFVPQEKVYVHMDNTCYFLGDTIWYAVYTRRTDSDVPSKISRVLYVELFNQDGYLVERQILEMKNGKGWGSFALPDTLYAGFYELRAYTRWQLNWGQYEHEHTYAEEELFYTLSMAKEYFRDYDKLYSRVFPIYDKPQEAGTYSHDMTLRPLQRYFKDDLPRPKFHLTLYPEGGTLVADAPCRMAFEVSNEQGETSNGRCEIIDSKNQVVAQANAVNRGRGLLLFTPKANEKYQAIFYTDSLNRRNDSITVKAKVRDIPENGIALMLNLREEALDIEVNARGTLTQKEFGYTIMHEGVVEEFGRLEGRSSNVTIPRSALLPGVNQMTLFDNEGRIYADRLFFVSSPNLMQPTVSISGVKEQYQPYEQITLNVEANGCREDSSSVSLAIRDATYTDELYDNANILVEMLLSSEIKGFVPNPGWYFEKDDEEHRFALDLLMLTQGWRRFDWREMATPGDFMITHPSEYSQILEGSVHKYNGYSTSQLNSYTVHYDSRWGVDRNELDRIFRESTQQYNNSFRENYFNMEQVADKLYAMGLSKEMIHRELRMEYGNRADLSFLNNKDWRTRWAGAYDQNRYHATDQVKYPDSRRARLPFKRTETGGFTFAKDRDTYASQQQYDAGVVNEQSKRHNDRPSWQRIIGNSSRWKHEPFIYAEFMKPNCQPIVGETATQNGLFRIVVPDIDGYCLMYLGASDSTKWNKRSILSSKKISSRRYKAKTHNGRPIVTQLQEDDPYGYTNDFPDFYVRLSYPYPRFVKPYSWYQTHLAPLSEKDHQLQLEAGFTLDENLREVTVRSRRGGLRRFDSSKPAFVVDAYDAFNATIDAGFNFGQFNADFSFNVAHTYISDMNMHRHYGVETRYDSISSSRSRTPFATYQYNLLSNLDKVYVYTDYAPRLEGSSRYSQSDQPNVTVNLIKYPEGVKRYHYVNRRVLLQGFNYPDEFYHVDYSHRVPSADEAKDYRRTLYWNPDLQLDQEGKATVTLYNNARHTSIKTSVAGQTSNGTLLY